MTSSRRRRTKKKKNTIVNFMTKIHATDTQTRALTDTLIHSYINTLSNITQKSNKLRQNLNPKKQNHHT